MIDAQSAILRALRSRVPPPIALSLRSAKATAWASATFTGARHCLQVRLDGEGADRFAAGLGADLEAAEFDFPGHLVADVAVGDVVPGEVGVDLAIEVLTVEAN